MLAKISLIFILPFLTLTALAPISVGAQNLKSDQALQQVCADGRAKDSPYCNDIKETDNPIAGNSGLINKIANLVSLVAGVVAVIVIIIGGLMMVLSGGDSQKFANGRNTVIYALVGVVLIVVARGIVAFVVGLTVK